MKVSRRKLIFVMTREGGRLDYTSGEIHDNWDDRVDEDNPRRPPAALKFYYEIPHVNATRFIHEYLRSHDIPLDVLGKYHLDSLTYEPVSLWHYTRDGMANYTKKERELMHHFFTMLHDTEYGKEEEAYYDEYADKLMLQWAQDHGCELFEDDSNEEAEAFWRSITSGKILEPEELIAEMKPYIDEQHALKQDSDDRNPRGQQ